MSANVECEYCNSSARLVTGDVIYPHRPDLRAKQFWNCAPCGAYVGCHIGTTNPLGRLANAALRTAKMKAHAAFDPIWKQRLAEKSKVDPTYRKQHARGGRYKELAGLLGIPVNECHIGMFDLDLCARTVVICESGAIS